MNTSFAAMFKTGTANQFQHVWALGATPEYTVGVWMGNFSGETIIGKTGSGIPARVAADILAGIADPSSTFADPPDSRVVSVCALSGELATDACPAVVQEFVRKADELQPCTFHRRTARGVETVYPPEYSTWLREGRKNGSTGDMTGVDAVEGGLEIMQPANGAVFFWDPSIPADQQAIGMEVVGRPEEHLEIWVNEPAGRDAASDRVSHPPHPEGGLRGRHPGNGPHMGRGALRGQVGCARGGGPPPVGRAPAGRPPIRAPRPARCGTRN